MLLRNLGRAWLILLLMLAKFTLLVDGLVWRVQDGFIGCRTPRRCLEDWTHRSTFLWPSSMAASVVRLMWQRRVLESMSQEPQAEAEKLSKNLTSTTF